MLIVPRKKSLLTRKPILTACLSFLFVIITGTFLLLLPISRNPNQNPTFIECLFTATSATCVSGETLCDIATKWSFFGRIVVMLLIQIGGIGLISFSTIFLIYLNKKISLKTMKLANTQVNIDDYSNLKTLFKQILKTTFLCEFIGGFILSFPLCSKFGIYGIFMALFTAISSYCNAGLDVNGFINPNCSLAPFKDDPLFLIVVSSLIFLGGIGFITISECFQLFKRRLKLRLLSIHSKITISTTLILLFLGFSFFLILEWNNSFSILNLNEKLKTSLFNSITVRTAGFNISDFSNLTVPTKLLTCLFMFIGCCPGGTGGGIKVTTLVVLLATVTQMLKNKEDSSILKFKINKITVYKAISLTLISATLIYTAVILIQLFDHNVSLINTIVITTSAFSTTGISVINLNNLTIFSKIILMTLMYFGRVGPLSLTIFFKNPSVNKNAISNPESNLHI